MMLTAILFGIPRLEQAQQVTRAQKDSISAANLARLNDAAAKLSKLLPPSLYPTYLVATPPYCFPTDSIVITEKQYVPLARMRRDTVFYVAPRTTIAAGDSVQFAVLCFSMTKKTALLSVQVP